jgi:molybdopterin/thiamine biosynthesis adenylyltransferase
VKLETGIAMDADEFYRERDSRTLKLVNGADYRNQRVLITVDDCSASSFDGQIMLFAAANLIARFCRRIDVQCGKQVEQLCIPFKFATDTLSGSTLTMLRRIDPHGDFRIVESSKSKDYNAVLSIGESSLSDNDSVNICSDGWKAFVSRKRKRLALGREPNPIGAGAAACLGTSEIFKDLVPRQNFTEYVQDVCFSALDYSVDKPDAENPKFPDAMNVGKVQMVGVGAVGSATIAFLDLMPLTGEIELIDSETVELSNLNRYMIAAIEDVGESKVAVGRKYLSSHEGVTVNAFCGKYEKYVEEKGRGNADVVLPLVDNNEARHQVQMNMPQSTIYGTTGDWTLTVARHKPLEDDCIICRYPKKEAEALPCGTVGIDPAAESEENKGRINAAVSFVSALAGVLVAGELAKRFYAKQFSHNFFQMDLASTPSRSHHFQRHATKECVCQTSWYRNVYKTLLSLSS